MGSRWGWWRAPHHTRPPPLACSRGLLREHLGAPGCQDRRLGSLAQLRCHLYYCEKAIPES